MITSLFKMFVMLGSEWVMWLLLALSLVSIAVILERFRALRSQERLGASLWSDRIEAWNKQFPSDFKTRAEEISKTYPCVEGTLIGMIASQADVKTKEDLGLMIDSFVGKKRLELEKNLSFLGTVGSNAPFIGLFGTVLGIIKAFADLSGGSEASMGHISSGISEALVATAIGLLVAIPAVIAYNYFQRKIKMILGRTESLSSFLLGNRG